MNTTKAINDFINSEMCKQDLKQIAITEALMQERLFDIMNFVNGIRHEFSGKYGWSDEEKEYFLKPMDRKFLYSYIITDIKDKILNMNFTSIYGDRMHLHCMYTGSDYRKMGLSKLSMLKICQRGMEDGFEIIGGFWPKLNNGSLILFLKLGLVIEYMRNDIELFLKGNLQDIAENAYQLYVKENQ